MNLFELIQKEIAYRKGGALCTILAVVMAVALYVAFQTTGEAAMRETIRLMRDMGYNLRIIPKNTEMNAFWAIGYSDQTMPETYVEAFTAYSKDTSLYNLLLAVLRQAVEIEGHHLVINGIAAEVCPPGMEKSSMIFEIPPGTLFVGYQAAQDLGMQQGGSLTLWGKAFTISRVLTETGTEEDIFLWAHLRDVQEGLHLHGRINEIRALECRCMSEDMDVLVLLRNQLSEILPDATVIQLQTIAKARQQQRRMAEKYFSFLMPVALLVSVVWIGALAWFNTRERRYELGVLRALGYGSVRIALLFLGKAMILGMVGAALGFLLGSWLAMAYGPEIFRVTARAIHVQPVLLGWVLLVAPLLTALASFIPAMLGVAQDPADVLRYE
ncbi:MAG: FtsX-like permease family protein [bacterium]|jgi:putative ABC transport system permease protein|nr:FtsX-like permease family protein [bacterium]